MNPRLVVLGLLAGQPKNGYEILQKLKANQQHIWAQLKPSSVYHALRTMHKEGLLELVPDPRAERFALTKNGKIELQNLLEQLWLEPNLPKNPYFTGVAFFDLLPKDRLVAALETTKIQFEQTRVNLEQSWQWYEQNHAVKTPAWLTFQNLLAHINTDYKLVCDLLEYLQTHDPEAMLVE